MSLKKELESLKRQKREELRRLNVTYLQTKRDVKRKLSPDRLIRKHVGATIGVAAVLGMLIAPRPTARVKEVAVKEGGGGGFIAGIFKTAMVQLENLFPKKKDAAQAEDLLKKP